MHNNPQELGQSRGTQSEFERSGRSTIILRSSERVEGLSQSSRDRVTRPTAQILRSSERVEGLSRSSRDRATAQILRSSERVGGLSRSSRDHCTNTSGAHREPGGLSENLEKFASVLRISERVGMTQSELKRLDTKAEFVRPYMPQQKRARAKSDPPQSGGHRGTTSVSVAQWLRCQL